MFKQEVVLRKDDIRKILEENPRRIRRVSMIVMIVVAATILFISFYIKYPITVTSRLSITSIEEQKEIKGLLFLEIDNIKLIKPGQKVRIKFYKYNIGEDPYLEGNVDSVAQVSGGENGYPVYIGFSKSDMGGSNKDVELGKDMQGTAEIVVKEEPLFTKLLKSIKIIPL